MEPKGPGFTVGRVINLILWSFTLIANSVCFILYHDGPEAGLMLLWIVTALIWIYRTCQRIKYGDPQPKGPGFTVGRVILLVLFGFILVDHTLTLFFYHGSNKILNVIWIVTSLLVIRWARRQIKYGDRQEKDREQ